MSDYKDALEAAGFTVHAYEQFGSYQGDWLAKVTAPNGREGYIRDYYGSCCGCDALEADIGYENSHCEKHEYHQYDCEDCKSVERKNLGEFGKKYIAEVLTKEEALAEASKNIDWDSDAKVMVDWINSN